MELLRAARQISEFLTGSGCSDLQVGENGPEACARLRSLDTSVREQAQSDSRVVQGLAGGLCDRSDVLQGLAEIVHRLVGAVRCNGQRVNNRARVFCFLAECADDVHDDVAHGLVGRAGCFCAVDDGS